MPKTVFSPLEVQFLTSNEYCIVRRACSRINTSKRIDGLRCLPDPQVYLSTSPKRSVDSLSLWVLVPTSRKKKFRSSFIESFVVCLIKWKRTLPSMCDTNGLETRDTLNNLLCRVILLYLSKCVWVVLTRPCKSGYRLTEWLIMYKTYSITYYSKSIWVK